MAIPTESLPPPGLDHEGIDLLLDMFPKGRLSEIVGPRSSGSSSLLMALLARATSSGHLAALVDVSDSFDPAIASAAGAELRGLLWVRCGGRSASALRATDLLTRCPGFAVVALDLGEVPPHRHPVPHAIGVRLQRAVESRPTVLVLRAPRHVTGSAAALVVSVTRVRSRWIGEPRPTRLGGLSSALRILQARGGSRGHPDTAWSIEWQP